MKIIGSMTVSISPGQLLAIIQEWVNNNFIDCECNPVAKVDAFEVDKDESALITLVGLDDSQ